MAEKSFMTVEEVAAELRVSKSKAYQIVRELNAELQKQGYLTVAGRVNATFFHKKVSATNRQELLPKKAPKTEKSGYFPDCFCKLPQTPRFPPGTRKPDPGFLPAACGRAETFLIYQMCCNIREGQLP